MKIVLLLMLGLASLGASVPQSRFGNSRFQPTRADANEDTTEAADVADSPAVRSKASKVHQESAGHDAGADENDKKEGTSAKPFVVDGEMKPSYGLDFAKERRRLANLRKRLLKPNNEEGEESAVAASPGDGQEAAPALGHRRAGAGQQDSNDEKAAAPALGHQRAGAGQHDSNDESAAAPASGHRRAGAGQHDSNDQESTPAKDEESQNPPASNIRRRFHSTSSSSLVSDASQGDKEKTSMGSTDDSSDQPPKETNSEKRRPPLRRRQQSTPAPSDDQSQDESVDAGSNTHSEATVSASPAERQEPAAGTTSQGSMKERLERYRQRQAGRLSTTSQTGTGDGSTDAQTSHPQSEAITKSNAKAKSDATAESGDAADAAATGSDSQNSGDDKPIA